jgi:YYY domain-containing protein
MTIEFYRALLSGELGWELAADFNEQPRVGPFKFNDQELPYTLVRNANTQGSPEGIWLPYPTAEEAFSVYDHNRVLIFRKTENYSRAKAEALLEKYDLTRTIKSTAKQHNNKPRGLVFDTQTWQAQQAGGTWSELFPRLSPLNQSQPLAAIAWLALIEMMGVAGFVLIASLARRTDDARLPFVDSGYSFGKTLGLLLVAFASWLLASLKLATFDRGVIWGAVAAVVALAALVGYRNRNEIFSLVKTGWKYILASELLFLAAFVFWLFVRMANPDLWHPFMGGEKPMDFAYLNAILKSTYFPPIDPWFAGGYINYYYFGWVFIGWVIKALGIDPSIAYNLAVPTLFALTAVGAFGLGASLYVAKSQKSDYKMQNVDARREEHESPLNPSPALALNPKPHASRIIAAGLIAALFVVIIGNGDQIRVVRPALEKMGGVEQGTAAPIALISGVGKWLSGEPLPTYPMAPYWDPTRPAPEVMIAEFPNFTFLYADLHAHMMAMPIALLALAFALAFALGSRRWSFVALAAISFGALWPTNTWDYFPYVLLGVAGLVIGRSKDEGQTTTDDGLTFERVVTALFKAMPSIVVLVALSRLFFAPYLENYGSAYSEIDPWGVGKDRTQIKTYVTIYGLFMIPLAVNALWSLFGSDDATSKRIGAFAFVVSAVGAVVLTMRSAPSSLLSVPMTIFSLAVALAPKTSPSARLLWLMNTGAFALTVFVEHFVLRGDIERMNTVFKFYIVAWLLLGVTSAVTLMALFDAWREKTTMLQKPDSSDEPDSYKTANATLRLSLFESPIARGAFGIGTAIAIFLALLYPVFAIPAKMRDRYVDAAPRSLDGMAYMLFARRAEEFNGQRADFELRHDYDAIKWMQDNIKGSPVIVEEGAAAGQQYRWSARYSIYTGLPSVVGWQWHQMQQRASADNRIVQDRVRDVNEFYSTPDIERAKLLLRRYGVKYIVFGQMERVYNAPEGFAKFDAMTQAKTLTAVYQNPDVTIYEVNATD